MAAESSKGTDAQLASDLADKSLEHPTEISKAADDLASGNVDEEGDEDDDEGGEDEQTTGVSGTGSTAAKKKKKKPRKKKKKATADDEPPELIPATTAAASKPKGAPVQDLQALLNQLALSQGPKKEGKAPEDYKFWKTQPVPQFQAPNLLQTTSSSNGESLPEGAILPDKVCRASAKPEPGALLDGFEWCLVDLENDSEIQELYDLLDNHYVEDADASFRFRYSKQFLSWALKPPGWKKEWHIGVRTTSQEDKKGRLVAFIAGIPVTMKVGESKFNATEINFLAIHRKLRGKRLAPELIKEVTRRCYLNGIYQALYTAGTLLPTPVSTCRYFHRSLDWEHLYKTGFSHLPPGSTELKQKYRYKVESHTSLKGLRPMKKEDVPAVKDLLTRYLDRFHLRQDWTDEEIEHWLCSEASKGVVWTSVVEIDGKITDFVSYYLLESTVLRSNNRQDTIRAAYLFYYASESAFASTSAKQTPKQLQESLAARLQLLMHDALILAKKDDFHVFNALTLLDNPLFLREEKFEPGDGKLHYYLFNWRTKPLGGGVDAENRIDVKKMGGIGVVML
ncbi:acyl-CoA N-acyltransferase [Neohortaea acidophila]|uniref:Glycylpeptide N-tetradecanoyltransferase n=1 Tax=Neohortaea acidophila TaxID=245834 RepID=A0A6A6PV48_9PEZI|nr:acyl-CoA N-acyltransferase [Neohortaea acidophila]KAF2484008.1 acyl-CoA N-acyltransferase [Neohortaea acidophila]